MVELKESSSKVKLVSEGQKSHLYCCYFVANPNHGGRCQSVK